MNNYLLHYAGICCTGLVRKNNQDNFWCAGRSLPVLHEDENLFSGIFSSAEKQWIAVFDGMGGEQCGEAASGLAALEFGQRTDALRNQDFPEDSPENTNEIMQELCLAMNEAVCRYAAENRIHRTGTTAAALCFGKEQIFGFNVGDSKCFACRDGVLTQLSTDHISHSALFRRKFLTQCIGMPDDIFPQPSVFHIPYREGDQFLLCSDGLTDMLPDKTIAELLALHRPLPESLELLRKNVYDNGAIDNTTIILVEIAGPSSSDDVQM